MGSSLGPTKMPQKKEVRMPNEIQYPVSIQPGQPGQFHVILTGDELEVGYL